jgi:hypothetical protein
MSQQTSNTQDEFFSQNICAIAVKQPGLSFSTSHPHLLEMAEKQGYEIEAPKNGVYRYLGGTMFKLTNENMENRGVIRKLGYNEDIHPFNTDEECCAGGIYYISEPCGAILENIRKQEFNISKGKMDRNMKSAGFTKEEKRKLISQVLLVPYDKLIHMKITVPAFSTERCGMDTTQVWNLLPDKDKFHHQNTSNHGDRATRRSDVIARLSHSLKFFRIDIDVRTSEITIKTKKIRKKKWGTTGVGQELESILRFITSRPTMQI